MQFTIGWGNTPIERMGKFTYLSWGLFPYFNIAISFYDTNNYFVALNKRCMSTGNIEFLIEKESDDSELSFDSMSVDAAKAFTFLINSLTSVIQHSEGGENIKIKLRSGSAVVETSEAPIAFISNVEKSFEDVVNGQSENKQLFEVWKGMQSYFRDHSIKFGASISKNGVTIPLTDKIKIKKPYKFKNPPLPNSKVKIIFIKGELIEAGGKNITNLHIEEVSSKSTIIIKCSRNSAKRATNYLYSRVLMSVWETSIEGFKPEYEYCDVYNTEEGFEYFRNLIETKMSTDYNKIQRLKDIHNECKAYVLMEDYGNLRRLLRLFLHDSVDVNILKTILIILYPVREHERIVELYDKMDKLFDKKMEQIRIAKSNKTQSLN